MDITHKEINMFFNRNKRVLLLKIRENGDPSYFHDSSRDGKRENK